MTQTDADEFFVISLTGANANAMKNKNPENDDFRPRYDFDYATMKSNRFASEKKGYEQTFVVLDEDCRRSFSLPRASTMLSFRDRAMRTAAQKPRSETARLMSSVGPQGPTCFASGIPTCRALSVGSVAANRLMNCVTYRSRTRM